MKILSILALLFLFACGDSNDDENINPNNNVTPITGNQLSVVELAQSNDDFSTLLAAVEVAGLTEALEADGPYTIFAPTNEAFAMLGQDTINNLLLPENKEILTQILLYHVVQAEVEATTAIELASENTMVDTLSGQQIGLSLQGEELFINDAKVINANLRASNGIIHVVDKVLMPMATPMPNIIETAQSVGIFNTLLAAVDAAELKEALNGEGPFTVFAPTDEAFAKLGEEAISNLLLPENKQALTQVLLYHVLSGEVLAETAVQLAANKSQVPALNGSTLTLSLDNEQLLINTSKVIQADVQTSNGVIHVIDSVLIP